MGGDAGARCPRCGRIARLVLDDFEIAAKRYEHAQNDDSPATCWVANDDAPRDTNIFRTE